MCRLVLLLDTNILVNLYFVYEDIPKIPDFLYNIKYKLGFSLETTDIILNELTNLKQEKFFFNCLSNYFNIISIAQEDVDEFRRKEALYNMGLGELSVLFYLKNNCNCSNRYFIFLTSDKRDILEKMERLKTTLSFSSNTKFVHGLFLYYLMFYENIYDKHVLQDILYSSNRDFRIRLTDRKVYEKYFKELYREIQQYFF